MTGTAIALPPAPTASDPRRRLASSAPNRPRGARSVERSRPRWQRTRRLARLVAVTVFALGAASAAQVMGVTAIPSVIGATVLAAAIWVWSGRRNPRRHLLAGVCVLALLLGGLSATSWSYTSYLSAPGAATTAVRTGDWMRDHGLSPIVDRMEQRLYGGPGPSNGRVARDQLPTATAARPTAPPVAMPPAAHPATVTGLVDQTLSGEGAWTPSSRTVKGRPVSYTTFVRPDPVHTDVVASAVWLDPQATRIIYVPGTKQGTGWAWQSGIPARQRPKLVAAFNGGFKFDDTAGGYFTEGRTPKPLVVGQASVVLHADGLTEIGAWGTQVKMGPDVISVRQNLRLIVDNGRPDPGLRSDITDKWGKRRWQLQYTNRSGLGITADHALVYVSGSNLTTGVARPSAGRCGGGPGHGARHPRQQPDLQLLLARTGDRWRGQRIQAGPSHAEQGRSLPHGGPARLLRRHHHRRASVMRPAIAAVSATAALVLLVACSGNDASAGKPMTSPSLRVTRAAGADPPFCPDAPQGTVLSRSVTSRATGGLEPLRIYIPPGFEHAPPDSVPLLVLLHGASADETQWIDVGIASAADCLIGSGEIDPMVIVTVDGSRADSRGDGGTAGQTPAMERFVTDELLPYLHGTYPTLGERDVTSIGGISRGGGWALRIAADRPDLFAAVGGHSAAGDLTADQMQSLADRNIRVWLDAGAQDGLRGSMLDLAASLRSIGHGSMVMTWAGGHDRLYWSNHVEDYLRFYGRAW